MLVEKYYRPAVHFIPPYGWLNDPNGLVYHQGEYHLFYQYHPFSNQWGPMHWGHAVSPDLLHWRHLPIALAPDELGACFSGTAVHDPQNSTGLFEQDGGLLAFYTIAGSEEKLGHPYTQSQGLAYSADAGRTWTKYQNNPVVPNPQTEDFRDPKVFWYEAGQYWVMLVTEGQSVAIYRSPNAMNWQYCSSFGAEHGAHDERAWECPDLFEMPIGDSDETRWVLIVGVQRKAYAPGSGSQYFIGHFDGERFINENAPETVLWLDYGRDFYATQSWSDLPEQDGRRLAISWMSNWLYANHTPTESWRSAMSIPHELYLRQTPEGLRIHHQFIRELNSLELKSEGLPAGSYACESMICLLSLLPAVLLSLTLRPESNSIVRLKPIQGTELYLESDAHSMFLRCVRQAKSGQVEFDQHYPHDYSIPMGHIREIDLQILIDQGSVEVLLDQGLYSVTNLAFPEAIPDDIAVDVLQGVVSLSRGEWSKLRSV